MTLALRLREQGKEVKLVEAAKEIGGLASAWKIGDAIWDRYYHVTLMSDLRGENLIPQASFCQWWARYWFQA